MKYPACPHCQQDHYVIKGGFNRTGSQRFRSQSCRHYFTPDPKPAGYDQSFRRQVLQLYLEGTSLRAIGRLLGLHHQSVSHWITEAA